MILEKNILLVVAVMCAAVAAARETSAGSLPSSAFADTEVSTNVIAALPVPLALVPNDTEVFTERTPSNTYAFTWMRGHPNRTKPFFDAVVYDAVDDITPSQTPMSRSAFPWGHDNGWWTMDGGLREMIIPSPGENGYVTWLPTFTATPGIAWWDAMTGRTLFSAVFSDLDSDEQANYRWSGSDAFIVIESPTESQTYANIMSLPSWSEATMTVTATLRGREYTSVLSFIAGTDNLPQARVSINLPTSLIVRDEWMEGSTSASGIVSFSCDVPTNGILRLSTAAGEKLDVDIPIPAQFTIENTDSFIRTFAVDGILKSDLVGDAVLTCEWIDAAGHVALSVTEGTTVLSGERVEIPNAPSTGVAVLDGTAVGMRLVTEPTLTVSPQVQWLMARRKLGNVYDPWTAVCRQGCFTQCAAYVGYVVRIQQTNGGKWQ